MKLFQKVQKGINMGEIHPEAAKWLSDFNQLQDDYNFALANLKLKDAHIDKLNEKLDQQTMLLKDISAKSDHYQTLCITMRTIFRSVGIQIIEGERAFINAPYENSVAMSAMQQPDDGKPIPRFLTRDEERQMNNPELPPEKELVNVADGLQEIVKTLPKANDGWANGHKHER